MVRFAAVIIVASLALAGTRAFGQFPALTPLTDSSPIRPAAQLSQLTEPTEPVLVNWGLAARLRENPVAAEWSNDPWGLSRAAIADEQQLEPSLRRLERRSGGWGDTNLDAISALWMGMRSKSEPTGKLKIRHVVSQELWYSKAKIDVPDLVANRPEPFAPRDWRAEETLRLSIPTMESLFVFGHFNTNADAFHYLGFLNRTFMREFDPSQQFFALHFA